MKVDSDLLARLKGMDEDTLRRAIGIIADSVGADSKQRDRALGNIGNIKRKLESASERDLQRMIGRIGDEKAEEIRRQLKL